MKRKIFRRLTVIVLVSMMVILGLNYFLQLESARNNMEKKSQLKLDQIQSILEGNEEDIERIKEELKEDYIIRAKAAAYIMQHHPEFEDELDEMKKIAELLQVDEFHLFNKEGVLYSGSEPKYYGYCFNSGEQMSFFLPMLEDPTLELCQDVTPNTAEGKLMQYVAVWKKDQSGIIQIGMQPYRLMEAMEKNELSYIFSMVTPEINTVIYAINKADGIIAGCTRQELIGKDADETGIQVPDNVTEDQGYFVSVDQTEYYCVFKDVGDWYIGITQEKGAMYQDVGRSMRYLFVYLLIVEAVVFFAILMQINGLIIQGIDRINARMHTITEGNLDMVVDVDTTREFRELSENINGMVKSLLNNTSNLSRLFDSVEAEIGVYEYRPNMKRVLTTRKTAELLCLKEEEQDRILGDKDLFEKRLQEIQHCVVEDAKDVCRVPAEEERYVKIRSFVKDGNTFGVILDVTEDVLEKQRIEQERDSDMLTGLCSRRAFLRRGAQILHDLEEHKMAMLLMADIDCLKTANDTYGHGFGDQLIQAAASLFKETEDGKALAGRLSGDEFVLLLYDYETEEEMQEEIEKIRRTMMEKTLELPAGGTYPVRLSAGYVIYPKQGTSFEGLMRLADRAMYRVKKNGKAGFVQYDSALDLE